MRSGFHILLISACVSLIMPSQAWSMSQEGMRGIYEQLVLAISDDRPAPRLVFAASNDAPVAEYAPESHSLQICAGLAEAFEGQPGLSSLGVAFLLGHELAHANLAHGQRLNFTGQAAGGADAVNVEMQADQFAFFYANMAGYPCADAAPQILERVYQHFGLPKAQKGYPPLAQRQAAVRKAAEDLQETLWVFEAGKRLLLTGQPEWAKACMDQVATRFPSRQVLNNAGVARAMQAYQLYQTGEMPWMLPFQMDMAGQPEQTLVADQPGSSTGRQKRRVKLLLEAEKMLQRASLKADSFFWPALNLACVHALQARWELAEAEAKELAKRPDKEISARARVLLALLPGLKGDKAATQKALAELDPQDIWVKRNLHSQQEASATLMTAAQEAGAEALVGWIPSKRETWDDTLFKAMQVNAPQGDTPLHLYGSTRQGAALVRIEWLGEEHLFAFTQPGFEGRNQKGLHLGLPLAKLVKAYGQPDFGVPVVQGTYWLYTSQRLAVLTDKAGNTQEWMVY
jgi:hypothetical protein